MQTVTDSVLAVNTSENGTRLVPCSITRRGSDSAFGFLLFPKSLKVLRPPAKHLENAIPPDRSETTLQGFSSKSRSRLRFTAANAADHISTQFCMTYADYWPIDGRECKRHLDMFLQRVRRKFPEIKYIWIGEFQTRGAPHFHFFSNIERNDENHKILADFWHEIAGVSQAKHQKVHAHAKNFIKWDMGSGSYLCKYLDKQHQKMIPQGFGSFGRWWGNSKNLKPVGVELSRAELDIFLSDSVNVSTGELMVEDAPQFLIRTLIKYQKKVNKSPWCYRRNQSMTVITGRSIFEQSLSYLENQKRRRFEK